MSSRQPEIRDLTLDSCCQDTLDKIKEIQAIGRILQGALTVSPFAVLFGASPADAAVTIVGTDWDLWRQSVQSVPAIVKNRCQTVAAFEMLKHGGGDKNKFWRAIYESFD